ncbi:MAG: pyrophosphokinae, partial [Shewanella sp.]|nr:pyrophosphokinae [Shewanella sp.]
MVSVREAHFQDPDFTLDDWVKRHVAQPEDAQKLLVLFQQLESLPLGKCRIPLAELQAKSRELIEILAPLNMDIDTLLASVLFVYFETGLLDDLYLQEHCSVALAALVRSVKTMDAIGYLQLNHDSRTA